MPVDAMPVNAMPERTRRKHKTRTGARAAGWAGAVALLLAVFSLYVRPDFMVMLADLAWACF